MELADSRDSIRIRINIESNFQLKPTSAGFIFNGPNFLSLAEELADVYRVTQADSLVGYKIEP